MANVTQAGERGHHGVPPAASPRLIEEAVRIFLALGITAADLRLRARPGSALATLAEAMEMPAGAQ